MTEIIGWDQFREDIQKLSEIIKENKRYYDVIVSISTGGLYPAGLLSKLIDTPKIINISCESYNEDNIQGEVIFYNKPHIEDFKDVNNILIVDDLIDSGNTIRAIKKQLQSIVFSTTQIDIACPYIKASYDDIEPIYSIGTYDKDQWVQFPWE